jgi:lysophospholipase L1-like esterase
MQLLSVRRISFALGALLLGTTGALTVAEGFFRVWRPQPGVLFPVGTTDFKRAPKARWYGWAHVPHSTIAVRNPDTGQTFPQHMNSEGWHDVEHEREKPPGTVRILFVGDSLTQGYVPLEDLYTRRLETLLNASGHAAEVISMGEGGFATDQALEIILRESAAYAPDWVVYQYYPNDVEANFRPYRTPPDRTHPKGQPPNFRWPSERKLFRYDLSEGELRKRDFLAELPRTPPGLYRANRALLKLMRHSALAYNAVMATGTLGWTRLYRYDTLIDSRRLPLRDHQPAVEKLLGLIDLIHTETERRGARLAVFAVSMDPFTRQLLFVHARGRYDVMIPSQRYRRYENDEHTNDEGNAQMARDLARYLAPRIASSID